MKRLVRKSSFLDHIRNDKIDIEPEKMENMMGMSELDEADIRHDRCSICKNKPLRREDGFKKCERCGTVYKILDGDSYVVSQDNGPEDQPQTENYTGVQPNKDNKISL